MSNIYDHANGKDITYIGYASCDSAGALGGLTSYVGRWESVTVDIKNEWATNTSSDAIEDQKRWLRQNWTAKLSGFITSGGSLAVEQALYAPYVAIIVTDALSGKTMTLKGGVDASSLTYNAESGKDELTVMSIGIPSSIIYN